MKKLNLKSFSVEKGEVLSRSQLKKVLGGDGPTTTEAGRCVRCECWDGDNTCWYTRRSATSLCNDVCGSGEFNAIDPFTCQPAPACTYN